MEIATTIAPDMTFTEAAAAKVRRLIEEENNPALKLRVFISGGGCSGFQYGFSFDEEVAEDDTAVQADGVTVLVDPMSYQYLVGAEVDYTAATNRLNYLRGDTIAKINQA